MDTFMLIGIMWVIAGVLGINNKFVAVSNSVKGTDNEKSYRNYRGKTFIILGIVWVAVALILLILNIQISIILRALIYVIASIPALIYEKKWKKEFK